MRDHSVVLFKNDLPFGTVKLLIGHDCFPVPRPTLTSAIRQKQFTIEQVMKVVHGVSQPGLSKRGRLGCASRGEFAAAQTHPGNGYGGRKLDFRFRTEKLLDKTLIVIKTEYGRPPEYDSGRRRGSAQIGSGKPTRSGRSEPDFLLGTSDARKAATSVAELSAAARLQVS